MNEYFSPKCALYHYINMAQGNFRQYLKEDMVKAKKYLYVLRPMLACRWILSNGTPPPIKFSELFERELPYELRPAVNQLLELKINSPEITLIPKIDILNNYLDLSILEIKKKIAMLENNPEKSWQKLNELFISQLDIAI